MWLTGLILRWHVGSSRTRDPTCVSCIGGWILIHCTTREVLEIILKMDRPKELSEIFISSIVCYSEEIAGNYSLKWWNRSTTFSNNTRMSKLNVQCFSKDSLRDFSDGAVVKNPPANSGDARDLGMIPGLGRSLGWEMATCPSSLVWKIPWREDPGRL